MRLLAALTTALTLLLVGGADASGVNGFKDWRVICDNLNTCVAFATPADEADIAWLRLERSGDAGAAVKIVIAVFAEDDPEVGGGPWVVRIDGKPVPGLAALNPVQDGTGFWRADVPLASTRRLALAARDGLSLTLTRRGGAPVSISLSGGAAALIWIDEQQGRIGSPTALSRAKGRPLVIAVPAKPAITAGPAQPQTGLPKTMPASVLKAIGDCEDLAETGSSAIIARLSPGVVLYAPVCSRGAYNEVFNLVLADEAGRGARTIALPQAQGFGPETLIDPMNLDYDPEHRILSSFAKGRGIGDCGDATQWVWDGKAFQLLSMIVMPDCRGVPVDDWPWLYQAVVR